MATYDYKGMKETSGIPEVKDLYHSSPVNFPDPISVNPQMKEQFGRDAVKSFETQAKVIASTVAAPAAGSGVLANAAVGGEHGARVFSAMQDKGTTDASEILGSVRTRAAYKLTKDPANISGQRNRTASIPADQLAAKGGKKTTGGQLANFLATDKVPPTIFGIPVVTRREDYTEADIRFFQEHPEAGGYYSMGDEGEE